MTGDKTAEFGARVQGAQVRINRAVQDLAAVNRTMPAGAGSFSFPETLDSAASINAMVALLVEQKLVDPEELAARKFENMAQAAEGLVDQARAHRREMSGIILPTSAAE